MGIVRASHYSCNNAAETHEGWLEDHRYLNMEFLKEQKKDVARLGA